MVAQPLQPFDVRNVTRGALGVPGQPFTFDPTACTAAEAAAGARTEPVELFTAVLPAVLGGFVSFAGVALGATLVMPPVLALIGRIGAKDPVVLLAGRNAMRAPGRSSRAC